MNSSATDTGPWASQPSSGALSDRRFYIRLGAVTLLAGLIYLIWQVIEPVWHPVAWALLLGTFLTPLNRRITARLDGRVGLASLVTVFLTTVFFVLPVAFLCPAASSAEEGRRTNTHSHSLDRFRQPPPGRIRVRFH